MWGLWGPDGGDLEVHWGILGDELTIGTDIYEKNGFMVGATVEVHVTTFLWRGEQIGGRENEKVKERKKKKGKGGKFEEAVVERDDDVL